MCGVLMKAALAAMLALAFAVAPARCDSANLSLSSSAGGAYIYDLSVSSVGSITFGPGDTLTLTGLAGVTGASAPLFGFSASSTSTTASAEIVQITETFGGPVGFDGVLTVDSTSLTIGTVEWELSGPDFSTPITGTTEGPVAAPEPGTIGLALIGLCGLACAVEFSRSKRSRT
jgi:hypothetical protein